MKAGQSRPLSRPGLAVRRNGTVVFSKDSRVDLRVMCPPCRMYLHKDVCGLLSGGIGSC